MSILALSRACHGLPFFATFSEKDYTSFHAVFSARCSSNALRSSSLHHSTLLSYALEPGPGLATILIPSSSNSNPFPSSPRILFLASLHSLITVSNPTHFLSSPSAAIARSHPQRALYATPTLQAFQSASFHFPSRYSTFLHTFVDSTSAIKLKIVRLVLAPPVAYTLVKRGSEASTVGEEGSYGVEESSRMTEARER